MPAGYVDGQFTSCEGELQDPVGTYTSNGQSEPSKVSCSPVVDLSLFPRD